jgi:hypothetical protein
MAFTPQVVTVTSGDDIHTVPGATGDDLPLSALAESKDGTPTPLTHETSETYSSSWHGLMMHAVRKDTATAIATAANKQAPLISDDQGRLWVRVGSSVQLAAGVEVIGKIDINSMPGTALTDTQVGNAPILNRAVLPDLTEQPLVHLNISAASSGDNTLLAAQGVGLAIRVLQIALWANGDVNVRLEDGSNNALFGETVNLLANQGFVLPFTGAQWLKDTANNSALVANLSSATAIRGTAIYTVIDNN